MQLLKYGAKFCFLIVLLQSCKKNALLTHTTGSSIYFASAGTEDGLFPPFATDSTVFTFGFSRPAVTDAVIKIAVSATGTPVSTDRKFKVAVDASSSAIAGTHYEALAAEYTLAAGRTTDTISIKLRRTDDMKTNPVELKLTLLPNSDFNTDLKQRAPLPQQTRPVSYINNKIIFSDIVVQTGKWPLYSIGKFTPKKFYLTCELAGLDPTWFIGEIETYEHVATGFYAATLLGRHLEEQRAAGTPVLYEDGTEMRIDDY
jgi:hypothetical protein